MPDYWDLRDVLHIDPDSQGNCVGEAKTYGRRCKVGISVSDLRTASRLLNEMDRSKRIAPEDLEELAALLLCKNFHNCRTKPHLNQIEEVSGMWSEIIAEEYSRVKKQKKKEEMLAAEKLRSEIRESLKEVRESMKKVKDDSKMEEMDKIHHAKPFSSKSSASSSRENVEDPFETQASSSARPNIFTRPSPQNNAQNTAMIADKDSASQNRDPSVAEGKKGPHPFGMPSPPTHEPSSRTKEPRIAIAEQQETEVTPLHDSDTITMSKFAFAFGSKSTSAVPAFQFETPTKPNTTQVEAAPSPGSQNVAAFSADFGFGTPNPPTAPISDANKTTEESKRIPLQEKAVKPLNVALSNKSGQSAFEFGSRDENLSRPFKFEVPLNLKQSPNIPTFSGFISGTSNLPTTPISEAKKTSEDLKRIKLQEQAAKPMNVAPSDKSGSSTYEFGSRDKTLLSAFEFEAPLKIQQQSKTNGSRPSPGLLFKVTQPEENDSKTPLTPTQPSKQPEESDVPFSPPVNGLPVERPTTPLPKEESFGYANVTPNSTRYTTYLPARQQYGLDTPPETPEMLVRALGKPMGESGFFRDERPREVGSPAPRVARKPLPTSPPPRVEDGGEEVDVVCSQCGGRVGHGIEECRCGDACEEVEVPTGCLARFGFRRLKEKVEGKLKEVKGRVPRRRGKDSTDSNNATALE